VPLILLYHLVVKVEDKHLNNQKAALVSFVKKTRKKQGDLGIGRLIFTVCWFWIEEGWGVFAPNNIGRFISPYFFCRWVVREKR
jgi:hypothetical protein